MKRGKNEQRGQGRRNSQCSNPETSAFNSNPSNSNNRGGRKQNRRGRGGQQEPNPPPLLQSPVFDPNSFPLVNNNCNRRGGTSKHYRNPRGRGGHQQANPLPSTQEKPFYSSVGSLIHGSGYRRGTTSHPFVNQLSNPGCFSNETRRNPTHHWKEHQPTQGWDSFHFERRENRNFESKNNHQKHQNHHRVNKEKTQQKKRYDSNRNKDESADQSHNSLSLSLPKIVQGGKVLLQRFLHDSRQVAGGGPFNPGGFDSDWEFVDSTSDVSQEEEDSKSFVSLSVQSDCLSSSNWNSKRIQRNTKPIGNSFPKIGVYWDIENCPVPKGKSVRAFVKRVRDTFYEGFQEEEFVVVCDVLKEKKEMVAELSNAQVELEHVISESKNAADEKLRQRMRLFSSAAEPQSRVVLITSDINFIGDLRDLRYRRNMNVILIHSKAVNSALKDFANENIAFEDFVNDLPSQNTQVQAKKTANLLIKNLLPHIPDDKLSSHLNKAFNNCGGKFVRILRCDNQSKTALMKFPCQENAIRARNRFTNYDILGRKIEIEFPSPEESSETVEKEKRVIQSNQKAIDDSGTVTAEAKATPCWVIVNGDVTITEATLKKSLSKTKLTEIFFQCTSDDSGRCRFCIQYSSQNQAKKVVKKLRDDLGSRITAEVQKNVAATSPQPTQMSEKDRTKQEFTAIRDHHVNQHKLTKTEMTNQVKQTNKEEVKEVINSRISLMEECLSEFYRVANQLLNKLNDSATNNRSVKMSLITECHRLALGTPVYAARTKILKAWRKEAVTIITGPPGIGKSSQTVQYLLEDSLAVNGLIAVVEPHRICAITHAHSVAKQYGSPVGAVVGYKVLINPSQKLPAKIIYMTDEILLHEYGKDRELKDYYCIVIDEIQERSDNTEILLPLLKNLLKTRGDLKIVLISANGNVSSLLQFFSPSVEVPIAVKDFPVRIMWDPKGKKSTYNEVVFRKVQQIIKDNETGDILAFLPHATDVLCVEIMLKQSYQNSELIIIGLHSEVTFHDVNSCMTENTRRRIILATSICENALSVTNVKFVIDSGVTKENSISNTLISKAEAEWRSRRAAAREDGRCYRLYSKDEFEANAIEKKNWNPQYDKLVLLLLKSGFSLANEFPFLEKIDKEGLMLAWRGLEEINAIQFGGLTQKGQLMAALNICPRLAMLITESLEDNQVVCFLIFLVAILSLNCIYPSKFSKEIKANRSIKVYPDILTILTSFNEWFQLKDKRQCKWCLENGVDAILMAKIKDKVLKFHTVITNEIGRNISLKSVNDQWCFAVQSTVLKCWKDNFSLQENLSTNTYQCLKKSKKVSLLPSCQFSSQPKYLVFDKIIDDETGRSFMHFAIPLDETVVKMAADNEALDIAKSLLNLDYVTHIVRPVGHHILRNFLRKNANSLITEISNLAGNNNISFEEKNNSEIIIKALDKEHLVLIQEKVDSTLQQERDQLLQGKFLYQDDKNAGLRAQIGVSGCINNVFLPEEYSEIIVEVPKAENIDLVVSEFEKFGKISHRSVKRSNKEASLQLKLQFDCPAEAKTAVNSKSSFKVTPCLPARNKERHIIPEFDVLVSWPRRKNKGTAVLHFDIKNGSFFSFQQSLLEQTLKPSVIEKAVIVADPSTTHILLKNLNPLVTKEEFILLIKYICRKSGVSLKNMEFPQEPGFTTSPEDLQVLHCKLLQLVTQYVESSSVKINILDPQVKDDSWKALLKFQDPHVGNIVLEDLNQGAEIDGIPIKLKKCDLNATFYCHKNIQEAIEKTMSDVLSQINSDSAKNGNELQIFLNPGLQEQDVSIEVRATNLDDYINNCFHISELLQGETVSVGELRMHFFKEKLEGKRILEGIASTHEIFIEVNELSKCLHLWGNSNNVKEAKEALEKFISEKTFDFLRFTLFQFGDAAGFLPELVEKFGSDFTHLSVETGCQDIDIDLNQHNLQFFGSTDAMEQAVVKLEELKKKFIENQSKNNPSSSDDECPICLSENVAEREHHRLEYCGHAYCLPCIAVVLTNCKSPLRCYQKNCNKPFVSLDFVAFCKEFKCLLRDFMNKEIRQFVQMNCQRLILCPVPLCEGILSISTDNTPIVCAVCANAVCKSCRTMYHYGQTCSTFKEFKP